MTGAKRYPRRIPTLPPVVFIVPSNHLLGLYTSASSPQISLFLNYFRSRKCQMCMTSVPVISNVRYDDMCPFGYMQFSYNVARRAIDRQQERQLRLAPPRGKDVEQRSQIVEFPMKTCVFKHRIAGRKVVFALITAFNTGSASSFTAPASSNASAAHTAHTSSRSGPCSSGWVASSKSIQLIEVTVFHKPLPEVC